jgi:hypothetical protein
MLGPLQRTVNAAEGRHIHEQFELVAGDAARAARALTVCRRSAYGPVPGEVTPNGWLKHIPAGHLVPVEKAAALAEVLTESTWRNGTRRSP